MAKTRVLVEFGMGTSLRRMDYTQASLRAIKDALWHNSVNMAELFGIEKEAMLIDVEMAVQQPDQVDTDALAGVFPYGQVSVTATQGGLDVPRPVGNPMVQIEAQIVENEADRKGPPRGGDVTEGIRLQSEHSRPCDHRKKRVHRIAG